MPDAGTTEVRFRAMGSDCHVVLVGGSQADLDFAEAQAARLEGLWSRFRPDSEVSRLNRSAGGWLEVSDDTVTLLCRAVRAQRLTGGWFDPFMGRQIVDLGYDRDFEELAGLAVAGAGITTATVRMGAGEVRLERHIPEAAIGVRLDDRTVRLPQGYDFDPGGIGKGLGADLVSRALVSRGVQGALVNLGGDLRCRGATPADGWVIAIDDPVGSGAALDEYVRLTDGAVATSTTMKRRWVGADGQQHSHVLHPGLGASVTDAVASVTVVAPAGWLAEALAKALLVGGPPIGEPLLRAHRAAGIVVTLDGSVMRL